MNWSLQGQHAPQDCQTNMNPFGTYLQVVQTCIIMYNIMDI